MASDTIYDHLAEMRMIADAAKEAGYQRIQAAPSDVIAMIDEIARLRAQLDGLAEHFDNEAKLHRVACNGPADAGKESAFSEAAAHVRGIAKSGGADGQG